MHATILKMYQKFSVRYDIQVDFGVKGGVEVVVHVDTTHCKPMAIIKFDFNNAFNMYRNYLLIEVKSNSLDIFPMFKQARGSQSNLYYNQDILLSKRGVQ